MYNCLNLIPVVNFRFWNDVQAFNSWYDFRNWTDTQNIFIFLVFRSYNHYSFFQKKEKMLNKLPIQGRRMLHSIWVQSVRMKWRLLLNFWEITNNKKKVFLYYVLLLQGFSLKPHWKDNKIGICEMTSVVWNYFSSRYKLSEYWYALSRDSSTKFNDGQ